MKKICCFILLLCFLTTNLFVIAKANETELSTFENFSYIEEKSVLTEEESFSFDFMGIIDDIGEIKVPETLNKISSVSKAFFCIFVSSFLLFIFYKIYINSNFKKAVTNKKEKHLKTNEDNKQNNGEFDKHNSVDSYNGGNDYESHR